MTAPILGLSSKATAGVLADLCRFLAERGGPVMVFESAGGVEVARRVRAGEPADLLVLADPVVGELAGEGLVLPRTVRPLFDSEVVLGVPESSGAPLLGTVDDLVLLLRRSATVGYSTGPSGTAFLDWVAESGLADEVGPRLLQAPPGVPVARLVAEERCAVGIQQRSEMTGHPGVLVVGPLPGSAAIRSTFTGAVLATSDRSDEAEQALARLGSPEGSALVEAGGLRPAEP